MSFDLDMFVDACVTSSTREEVAAHVARAVERRGELLATLGPIEEHVVHTLHASVDRTVQILGWAPGMRAPAHEHRMWSVIGVCAGREDNVYWQRAGRTIERTGARALEPGDVVVMDDDVIHSVINPLDAFTIAIHVYGGDIRSVARSMWHPFTCVEEPFDNARLDRLIEAFNERQRREPVPFAAANVPRIMQELFADLEQRSARSPGT